MKKTIISCIVAILCTVAVCVTYAVKAPSDTKNTSSSVSDSSSYMTEKEAADYIGVSENVLNMMRVKLRYMEGAYMSYTYTNDSGKEVTEIVYKKDKLDAVVEKLMKDSNALNFRYIEKADTTEAK